MSTSCALRAVLTSNVTQPTPRTSLKLVGRKPTFPSRARLVEGVGWVNRTCMQLQSSAPLWLDTGDEDDRSSSHASSPDLAEVLSEIEEEPKQAPEAGQAEPDDALGAYLREIGRGTLLTKQQEIELANQIAPPPHPPPPPLPPPNTRPR